MQDKRYFTAHRSCTGFGSYDENIITSQQQNAQRSAQGCSDLRFINIFTWQ
jgi:hypothetical protein